MTTSKTKKKPASTPPPLPMGRFEIVSIERCIPWKDQPRKYFSEASIEELAADIREKGLLHPPTVRPHGSVAPSEFLMVAGERRLRACLRAGLPEIGVLVRDLTDEQAYDIALAENLQRKDLSPLEESDAYHHQVEMYHRSVAEIATKVKLSQQHVYQMLSLQRLTAKVRGQFAADELGGVSIAIELARIHNGPQQERAADALIDKQITNLPTARSFIRSQYVLNLADAKFDTKDKNLVPKAGPCSACPKNTATQTEMFAGDNKSAFCLDEACYKDKQNAYWTKITATATQKGQKVIEGPEAARVLVHGSLKWDGALDDLDRPMSQAGADKTLGKALAPYLKKHPDAVVLIRNDEGKIIEAIDKKICERAKAELGLLPKAPPTSEAEKKARLEKMTAEAISDELRRLVLRELRSGKPLDGQRKSWKVARQLLGRVLLDIGQKTEVIDRLNMTDRSLDANLAQLSEKSPHDVVMALLEVAIDIYLQPRGEVSEGLKSIADELSIDVASVEKVETEKIAERLKDSKEPK